MSTEDNLAGLFDDMLAEHEPVWGCEEHGTREVAWALAMEAADRALNAVPCVCHEAYWKRDLEDPGCSHHDLARELGVPERSSTHPSVDQRRA